MAVSEHVMLEVVSTSAAVIKTIVIIMHSHAKD